MGGAKVSTLDKSWNGNDFKGLAVDVRDLVRVWFATCHPRAGGDPWRACRNWIPACAGMTAEVVLTMWIHPCRMTP